MAMSNRELLMQQRKKEKGFQSPVTAAAPKKDTSRLTGRKQPLTTGFQGITKRKGQAQLEETPGAVKGIRDVHSALAGEFKGFKPPKGVIDVPGEEVDAGGMPVTVSEGRRLTPSVRAGIEAESGSEIGTKQRRDMGLGEFAPGKRGGGAGGFGLPTDRMPSFAELGGAIGQMFKHVGGIIKKRKALGLIPGRTDTTAKGLAPKDRATILTKRLDDLTLTEDERKSIKAELDTIIHPQKAVVASDVDAILNL